MSIKRERSSRPNSRQHRLLTVHLLSAMPGRPMGRLHRPTRHSTDPQLHTFHRHRVTLQLQLIARLHQLTPHRYQQQRVVDTVPAPLHTHRNSPTALSSRANQPRAIRSPPRLIHPSVAQSRALQLVNRRSHPLPTLGMADTPLVAGGQVHLRRSSCQKSRWILQ